MYQVIRKRSRSYCDDPEEYRATWVVLFYSITAAREAIAEDAVEFYKKENE